MKMMIAIATASVALAGCQTWPHTADRHPDRRYDHRRPEIREGDPTQVREAKREVSRRCGPSTTERRRGTDGTQTADYDCGTVSAERKRK